MRVFFVKSLVFVIVFGISFSFAENRAIDMTILHINDHHSHLEGESLDLTIKDEKYRVEVGGMARVASLIKTLKSSNKNPLVLHAGDAMSGTLYFTLFKGQADVELMNMIGFDAFTLGNHEFDEGDDVLADFISKANFPVITSNVEAAQCSILYDKWKPYIIKEIEGQKVAIIGLETAQKTGASSRPSKNVFFFDEVFRTQKAVNELKAKGIDKIILLSHFGYENDLELASKVDGVDVIIGGDSHSLLGDFKAIGLTSSGAYPTVVKSKSGQNVCVAQAWEYAKALGELHVAFDKNGDVSSCNGKTHLPISSKIERYSAVAKDPWWTLDKDKAKELLESSFRKDSEILIVEEDENIAKKLALYEKQIKTKSSQIAGIISEDMRHIRVPGKTYEGVEGSLLPFGSELAPVIAASFYNSSLRADACIQNAGGVRSGLKSGTLTIGDVYSLLPFANTLIEVDMTGAEVKQVLEDALINFYDNHGSDGSFPYAYALRYDIDMNRPKNDRVFNIEIKSRIDGKWMPIDMNKRYVVAVNSYISEGRDGYTTFAQIDKKNKVDTYLDYAMSFAKYIESFKKQGKKVIKISDSDRCIKSYKTEK